MKQFMCCVLLVMVSLFSHAEATLVFNKKEMIDLAIDHAKKGKNCMSQLDGIRSYLPDLGSKEHMDALIQSAVLSVAVKNPRAKILAIGLRIIGSLVVESHTNYLKARSLLYQASYHFEMANYYNTFSLNVPGFKWMDSGTKQFFAAIDDLTICVMLTDCIKDKWVKDILLGYFMDHRDDMIKQFMDANKKLTYSIYDDALLFYENVAEICSEVEDDQLREELCIYTGSAVESIACALRDLENFNCWPNLDEWKRVMWARN